MWDQAYAIPVPRLLEVLLHMHLLLQSAQLLARMLAAPGAGLARLAWFCFLETSGRAGCPRPCHA